MTACACWLYLLAVIFLWTLLRWSDLWWPATVFLFSPRWLVTLPAVVLLPMALLWRRSASLIVLLALTLVAGPIMGLCVTWPRTSAATNDGLHVRVLTCNIHYRQPDLAKVRALLATAKPDIVAFQEWPDRGPAQLFDSADWHVHRAPHLFLASRFPIRDARPVGDHFMSKHGAALCYQLESPAGLVNFFSVHLASPRQGLYLTIHDTTKGMVTVEAGSTLRWKQCETLMVDANALIGPVLLAGDFNTPPESAIFRELLHGYTDAFSAAGFGWGYTFKGGKTTVRIDHILAGPGWQCERCWVAPSVGSPHRPVLADLFLPAAR